MIEADALPDRNMSCFTSSNIIYDPNVAVQYSEHANIVAAIMVAQATTVGGVIYEGIVPDAKLYATYYVSGNYSDWRARVEWLLSQGVNVINMSAGFKNATAGAYGTHERWLDHIAINHSVHFVKSAGNDSASISAPGMAYNILTVGAIDDKNTTSYGDDLITNFSNYNESSGLTNKPDLVAPGYSIYTAISRNPLTTHGTSFATPHVTATIAQLCQRKPALKLLQDVMKAILTASISHDLAFEWADSAYNVYGAGVVDSRSAIYTADSNRYLSGSFPANGEIGAEKSYTFNVTSSDEIIRVSLSWLKFSTISGVHSETNPNDYTLANLNLKILDPEGELVDTSFSLYNNTEIVYFEPKNKIGKYTIVIRQYAPSNKTVYFGLAWW